MKLKLVAAGVAASTFALGAAGASHAVTLFDGGTAEAVITGTSTSLTVAISNLVADPASAGQEISGIQIFFNGGPTSASLTSQAGKLISWNSKKPLTWSFPGGNPNHWGSTLSGSEIHLTALTSSKPDDLITGTGPSYTGDASIYEHTPSIVGTGTFKLSWLGEVLPTIRDVIFEFGTGPDSRSSTIDCSSGCNVIPTTTGVPEPATWAMMLIGITGLGGIIRSRRRTAMA
jgi:hypothetical protein